MRTLAIGDIHGCRLSLDALLDAVSPTRDDLLVTLGDCGDWGPDSRGVIDRLLLPTRSR
jgi:serine/threonine protein phosphatase 1